MALGIREGVELDMEISCVVEVWLRATKSLSCES
jgi:hypothetical protein